MLKGTPAQVFLHGCYTREKGVIPFYHSYCTSLGHLYSDLVQGHQIVDACSTCGRKKDLYANSLTFSFFCNYIPFNKTKTSIQVFALKVILDACVKLKGQQTDLVQDIQHKMPILGLDHRTGMVFIHSFVLCYMNNLALFRIKLHVPLLLLEYHIVQIVLEDMRRSLMVRYTAALSANSLT